jgi:molybdopterin synthase sulfur carrier subunit
VIVILVPGVLRGETAGASRLELEPAVGGTLGAVLDTVDARWPRLHRRIRDERGELRRYVNVYVDGEDCRRLAGLATAVPDGAEIQVLPSVAGGAGT